MLSSCYPGSKKNGASTVATPQIGSPASTVSSPTNAAIDRKTGAQLAAPATMISELPTFTLPYVVLKPGSHILIVNSGEKFLHSNGTLCQHAVSLLTKYFEDQGHEVKLTETWKEWDVKEEGDKVKWANVVIYQFPAWWMSAPWHQKKWFDYVFCLNSGFIESDGRSRNDPSKKYGSGGLMQDKHYMLSMSWNAPADAFEDKDGFYFGLGAEYAVLHMHLPNRFCGMQSLPTFCFNDVMKAPKISNDEERLEEHLHRVFRTSA